MRKIENFENVQAVTGDFARPTAGGYICKIVNVVDTPMDANTGKGDYLRVEYDICDGEFSGFYMEQYSKFGGTWNASFIRSYKEKALGMFKHFVNCVEKSNSGYTWNFVESELIGKVVGLVLGEEEYKNNNGEVKTKLAVKEVKTVEQIKSGDFKVPAPKKLQEEASNSDFMTPAFMPAMKDEDLPF